MVTTEVEMTSLVVILLFHMGLKDLVQNVNNCNSITCTNANDSLCNIGKNQNKCAQNVQKLKAVIFLQKNHLFLHVHQMIIQNAKQGIVYQCFIQKTLLVYGTAVDFTLPSLSKYFIQSIKNKKNLASSIGLTSVCIDNKDVRNKIMKSKNISIITVPTILLIYHNGNMKNTKEKVHLIGLKRCLNNLYHHHHHLHLHHLHHHHHLLEEPPVLKVTKKQQKKIIEEDDEEDDEEEELRPIIKTKSTKNSVKKPSTNNGR